MEPLPSASSHLAPDPPQRWHGLDAVRAFALLLGIWLHASLAFLPGGYFVIENNTHSATLKVIFYVIHIFRMSLFFLIAGFFARAMRERRGTAGFIRDRSLRIGLTGLLGWAACMGLIHLVFVWTIAHYEGTVVTLSMLGWPFFWLTHLWFLYYLLWLYALTLTVRALWIRLDADGDLSAAIDRLVSRAAHNHSLPLAGALAMAITLYCVEDWYLWGGIPTPDREPLPQPSAIFGYGVPFACGWLLHRQPELLRVWERRWWQYSLAAVACIAISHYLVSVADVRLREAATGQALYAACYALATWTTMLALIGLGTRFFSRPSPRWRYLADSSYWLYVAHVPLVFALQTAVMDLQLHWSLKFAFIMVVTCGVLLLIYHYCVRSTGIGLLMNGRKHPRTPLAALWQGTAPQSFPASADHAEV
jgi:surface polysaccharide O-acyltransferase-like enzyme